MAAVFTNTATSVKLDHNGNIIEEGTWVASGGSTGGTIIANTSIGSTHIAQIESADFYSDTSPPTNIAKRLVLPSSVEIAVTANDTGSYRLVGRPA